MWLPINQIKNASLILILQIILNSNAEPEGYLPLWTWECVNDRCVPSRVTGALKIQSLQMCNMLCATMQLWPQPTGPVSLASTAVSVRADLFHMQVIATPSKAVHEHLEEAFNLFREDLRHMERHAFGFAEWRDIAVIITVNGSGDPRMRLNTDESYSLLMHPQVETGGPMVAKIAAKSFCGARHGLETLQQLIWFDPYVGTLFMLEAAKIEDSPHFGYRGLLLDTARNFFPVHDIIRTIDAMATSKLNTFHWHISDAQAFPLRLSSVPQLALYGAYGPGAIYTTDDVRKIATRARLRGIRVIIEIDIPAHVGCAWNWGPSLGFDELVQCVDTEDWFQYCQEPPCGQLNPRNPHVFNILEAVFTEIIHLTGVDDVFHLGGDDISERCWMKYYTNIDFNQLLEEYTRIVLERLDNANGRLPNLTMFWESRLTEIAKSYLGEYAANIGFQTRVSEMSAETQKFLRGFPTVLSETDPWDLNSGMGEWYEDINGAPYNSWQRIYEHRPWARGNALHNVIGAEVTVWSAMLSVGGLDSRVWPRAAAFAERVWSDRPEGATRPVHVRLDVHRSRLNARGIRAAPIWSMWCSQHTYTCG